MSALAAGVLAQGQVDWNNEDVHLVIGVLVVFIPLLLALRSKKKKGGSGHG